MASTYLSKTFSAGNQKTWTWSFWTKIPNYDASNNKAIFSGYNDANNVMKIQFTNTDQFQSYGLSGGTLVCRLVTNQLFRDYNGWYHIVYSLDTTQATSTDRQKLWVNGEEVTSFSTRTDPSQNADLQINNTIGHQIGAANNADHYSNCMAHCHFIDGTRYDASAFGETDATSGIWKPKTSPSVTYGTNGFFLKFANSASLGTDSSGNGNNFTVNGSGTQTLDTPSNVFATLNPLIPSSVTYSGGNLTAVIASTNSTASTLSAGTGKFYFETKLNDVQNTYIGICSERNTGADFSGYRPLAESALINATAGAIYIASGPTGLKGLPIMATNDIIGCAFDVDNGKLWWSQNGQWYTANSSTATTITIADVEAGNNGYDFSSWTGQFVLGAFGTSTVANDISINFGNGYFGTTAVSTPQSDSAGIGKFEYSVPSGYYALCTKNIATYG